MAAALLVAGAAAVGLAAAEDTRLRELISRADLEYAAPVARSEDGLPLGNGRMGSLLWTTPASLRLQVNRVDVQPIDASTDSFPERNRDYMGGCGFVDLDLGLAGGEIFTAEGGPQRLSIYDALMSITGRGVAARLVALPDCDVFAVEIEDRRPWPQPLAINLRMLRYASEYFGGELERMQSEHIVAVRTRNHVAASQLHLRGDRIMLTQDFREGDHHAKSALVAAVVGRAAQPALPNETTAQLILPPLTGRTLVLIASAATLNAADDVGAAAFGQLDAAIARASAAAAGAEGFTALAAQTADWWHEFWRRGFVDLHSADGQADFVAANYHYFLYQMGATSRGRFPPKFNGLLWNTAGDLRTWGAQHWFANLSCYYEAIFAANRLELLDPVFAMYSGMHDACALAARQQWGSAGMFIPETVWFDGLARLPEDIAAEMRDLYLLRKPWAERSARFMAFARTKNPHSSRWNWLGGGSHVAGEWTPAERGNGPFGPVTHILGTTAKVAYLYWRRYEYTLDRAWLRHRAYPLIRDAAEFYRNFPNLTREADGRWHMHHTNSNESVQDVRDSDEDLSAMRGIFAVAIRAAELLGTDEALRGRWRDVLAGLPPLPTSADADAIKPADYNGPPVFVRGRTPVVTGRGFLPDGNSLPQWFFDLCNPDSPDAGTLAAAQATFDRAMRGGPPTAGTPVGVLSKLAIAGTTLGRVEATRFLVPNQMRGLTSERTTAYRGGGVLANRLALREGPQAFDCERLGRAAEALQIALVNSAPAAPAEEPTIRLFAAWPPEWDARFTLRARGGFVITAAQRGGRVEFAEVVSEAGAELRLHNPWRDGHVAVERSDGHRETLQGPLLRLPTRTGERLRFTPAEPATLTTGGR